MAGEHLFLWICGKLAELRSCDWWLLKGSTFQALCQEVGDEYFYLWCKVVLMFTPAGRLVKHILLSVPSGEGKKAKQTHLVFRCLFWVNLWFDSHWGTPICDCALSLWEIFPPLGSRCRPLGLISAGLELVWSQCLAYGNFSRTDADCRQDLYLSGADEETGSESAQSVRLETFNRWRMTISLSGFSYY